MSSSWIPVSYCLPTNTRLVLIEFPCIIENENAAIQGLNADQLSAEQSGDPDAVVEWARPAMRPAAPSPLPGSATGGTRSRWIRPLVGRRSEAAHSRFVVRLRRKRGSSAIAAIQCIGMVTESIVFGREMADFQFGIARSGVDFLSPLSSLQECATVQALDAILARLKQPATAATGVRETLFPPPFFTPYHIPIVYCHTAYPLSASEPASPKNPRALRHLALHYRSIYDEAARPCAPSASPALNLPDVLLAKLAALLQERPIWSSRAIYQQFCLPDERGPLKQALKRLAFYWYDGPWRGCWNRMDYDPRTIPESRSYQILELRSLAKEKSASLTASHVLDEGGVQSNLYQYVDIRDKDALVLLASRKEWSNSFHARLGWWRPGFREKIMAILKLKYRGSSQNGLEISRGIRFPRRPREPKERTGPRGAPVTEGALLGRFETSSDFEEAEDDDHDGAPKDSHHHDDEDIYQIFDDEIYTDDEDADGHH